MAYWRAAILREFAFKCGHKRPARKGVAVNDIADRGVELLADGLVVGVEI